MKKQYIFLVMIFIILYLSYLIISFTYKDNNKNQYIEELVKLINQIEQDLVLGEEKKLYQESEAYKIKIRKEEQSKKLPGESVIYLTTEEKYNKFTQVSEVAEINNSISAKEEEDPIEQMSVFEKWMYFIFKKDSNL